MTTETAPAVEYINEVWDYCAGCVRNRPDSLHSDYYCVECCYALLGCEACMLSFYGVTYDAFLESWG